MDDQVCATDREGSAQTETEDSCILADGRNLHQGERQVDLLLPGGRQIRKALDFMLSERRDEAAATAFFTRAIGNNGFPDRVVIDKSGANLAGLQNMNCLLILNGWYWLIDILQVKCLNNIIEQDHRLIKKLTRQMKGFRSFNSASATLEGIEVAQMIRKRQFDSSGQSPFQQFAALAG